MNFGKAIEALKQGKKVTRKGWNGKGMFLWLKPATVLKSDFVRDPILKQAVEDNGGTMNALGTICMKTADNQVLTGWLASQTDMLSEDWEIVGSNETAKENKDDASQQTILSIEKQIDDWKEEDDDKRGYIFLAFEDKDDDTGSLHCAISGKKTILCEGFEQAMNTKDSDLKKIVLISSIIGMKKFNPIFKM